MKTNNVNAELKLAIADPILPAPPIDYQLGFNKGNDYSNFLPAIPIIAASKADKVKVGTPSAAQKKSAQDLANQLYPASTDFPTLQTQLEEISQRISGLKGQINDKSGVGKALSLGRQYKLNGKTQEEVNDIIAKINAFVAKRAQIEVAMVKAKKTYEKAQEEAAKQEAAAAATQGAQAAAAQSATAGTANNKLLLYAGVAVAAFIVYKVVKG